MVRRGRRHTGRPPRWHHGADPRRWKLAPAPGLPAWGSSPISPARHRSHYHDLTKRPGGLARTAGYAEHMSGAAAAPPAPDPRSGTWRMAELLCALSYGSGLAAAERMEHGTNTAFVGIQLGRALGLGADGMEAVFYGALLKDGDAVPAARCWPRSSPTTRGLPCSG